MYILLRNDTMKDGFVIPLRKKKRFVIPSIGKN
jgi:hypothetical protein